MRVSKWATVGMSPMLLLALSGCTSAAEMNDPMADLPEVSIEGLEAVKAELAFDSGTAQTPLDPYLIGYSFEIEVKRAQASAKFYEGCMSEFGYEDSEFTEVDWDGLRPQEERMFGLWDVGAAAKHGLDLDWSLGVPEPESELERGQGYADAILVCSGKREEDAAFAPIIQKLEETQFVSDRIQGMSMYLAEESDEGKAATAKFAACMKDRGLVLNPDSGYVSSDYSEQGKEAEITAALGEAECNVSTGRVQTLYDLRARYETAYMKKYESQLEAVMKEKQAILAQLEGIINAEESGSSTPRGEG